MRTLAAVLVRPNQSLELREIESPPVGQGCVLVRTLITGVCGTDVHCQKGQVPLPYPVILGHESIGVIETLDKNRKLDSVGQPVSEGDRIFWVAGHPCGSCYYCLVLKDTTSCPNRRSYGTNWSSGTYPYLTGGYSKHVFLTEKTFFFKVPDSVPSEAAIALGCGFPTAVKGFESLGRIQPDDTVIIQGAGPVGLSSLVVARIAGAAKVIVLGAPAERLDMAKQLGASEVIDISDQESLRARISRNRENTGLADICVEASGNPAAVSQGIEMLKPNARYLVLGVFSDLGEVQINPSLIVRKNIMIRGSVYWEPSHLYRVLKILTLRDSELKLENVVTNRYSLERANEALSDVGELRCVKAVIQP